MAKLIKREIVLAKVEATAGIAETPSASTDYVRVMEVSSAPEGTRIIDRSGVASGTQGAYKSLYGGSMENLSFSWEIAPGVSPSSLPEHHALYQAVGLAFNTDNAYDPDPADPNNPTGSATTYSLQSDLNSPTATLAYYQDGSLRTVVGARATSFAIEAATGATLRANATYVGKLGAESDVALPAATVSGATPLRVVDATLTIDGTTSFVVENFSLDFGLNAPLTPDMSEPDGYTLVRIVDRALSLTVNPEKVANTSKNFRAIFRANSDVAISLSVGTSRIGDANASGRCEIILPQCVLTEPSDGDRSGIRTDELTFMCHRTDAAGDNEATIRFS